MLKEKIKNDLKTALKSQKELEVSVLRMLLADLSNKETEKRTRLWKEKPDSLASELERESQLTEEEILDLIFSEIKKRKEAISEFEKGKREDLVKKEKEEIEILKKYLPKQLSEEEIKDLAREAIKKLGVRGIREMGKVMAELMPKIKGRAEGQLVSQIVKELLIKNEKS